MGCGPSHSGTAVQNTPAKSAPPPGNSSGRIAGKTIQDSFVVSKVKRKPVAELNAAHQPPDPNAASKTFKVKFNVPGSEADDNENEPSANTVDGQPKEEPERRTRFEMPATPAAPKSESEQPWEGDDGKARGHNPQSDASSQGNDMAHDIKRIATPKPSSTGDCASSIDERCDSEASDALSPHLNRIKLQPLPAAANSGNGDVVEEAL